MLDFTKELKESKVLIKEDLLRIREYIQNKYPHYSPQRRAEILANAIEGIIDKHLDGFPPQHRQRIQDQIFRGPLIKNPDGVFLYDIFEVSLALSVENKDEQFLQEVCSWANGNVRSPIQLAEMITYQNDFKYNLLNNQTHESNKTVENSGLDVAQEFLKQEPLESANKSLIEKHPSVEEDSSLVKDEVKFIKKTPEKYSLPKGLFTTVTIPTYIAVSVLILFFVGRLMMPVSADEDSTLPPTAHVVQAPAHLPTHFHYREVDTGKLKTYLTTRNSLLQEEPYYTAIHDAAKEFGLNPLVLFAITGHEQGFVPKDHPSALKIANNPFNVFHSWQDYNTTISDSAEIAARTVVNLSKDRPNDVDAFQWINRKYAEDQNWWMGVKSIFNRLEKVVE